MAQSVIRGLNPAFVEASTAVCALTFLLPNPMTTQIKTGDTVRVNSMVDYGTFKVTEANDPTNSFVICHSVMPDGSIGKFFSTLLKNEVFSVPVLNFTTKRVRVDKQRVTQWTVFKGADKIASGYCDCKRDGENDARVFIQMEKSKLNTPHTPNPMDRTFVK